jgi:DNA-3-methyladenine glycosylase
LIIFTKKMNPLPPEFYKRENVVQISRELLGKVLFTSIDGVLTAGVISETEAYEGATDKASHAYGNRRTKRTEILFGEGGTAYVYLCYGIHHLFNVVTNKQEVPHAILVRAVKPYLGDDQMLKRRRASAGKINTVGPGNVSQALGITTTYTGVSLQGPLIWIEDRGVRIAPRHVHVSPRIGVDYAGDHAAWPYRFFVEHSDIHF